MRGAAALAGIAVVFGGPSPEHDVSILTGLQAVRALVTSPSREEVTALYWSKTGELWRCPVDAEAKDFADGVPRSSGSCWLQFGRDAGLWTGAGRLGRD
jgi:D-alanine-D-alanine ligase